MQTEEYFPHCTVLLPTIFAVRVRNGDGDVIAWKKYLGLECSAPQSRQSAKLFLQSSDLGLPQPLTLGRVLPPPPPTPGGRGTLAGERGGGRVPILTKGHTCGTLYKYVLCDLIALPPGGRSPYYLSTWEAWATGAMPWGNGTWAATPRRSRPPTGISAHTSFYLVELSITRSA